MLFALVELRAVSDKSLIQISSTLEQVLNVAQTHLSLKLKNEQKMYHVALIETFIKHVITI